MSEPIRVLQVFGRMNRGGAESMLMNLYRNIDRTKVQFDFVVHTDKECDFDAEIKGLGGMIYSVPRYNGRNHFKYVKAWKCFFKDHPEYKVIHGHIYSVASIYLRIAKKFGLTTISHSHSTSSGTGLVACVQKVLEHPLRNIADWLFACSDMAGKWLYGENVSKRDNYYVLKNAIETEKYKYDEALARNIRSELGINDEFVFGHVGRFTTPKNHTFLIDVFNCVYKKDKNTRLLLVGDGRLRTDIEEKVAALGIKDAVIMTGVRPDVDAVLQAIDCFVFPSLYEGLPVTVVEAQTAGLRCFVSDTITDEVCITEYVEKIPIDKGVDCWAQALLKATKKKVRYDLTDKIVDSGYDVKFTAIWLQEFYLGECKK